MELNRNKEERVAEWNVRIVNNSLPPIGNILKILLPGVFISSGLFHRWS